LLSAPAPAAVQATVTDHIARQLPAHIGVTLGGLGDVFASPVVTNARTAAMAAEWSAATAAVVWLACASCARRPIEGEAGFLVIPVPVYNFRGLLANAGMAALTLSPDAEREYGALPERLAVWPRPSPACPRLAPDCSTSTHLCCCAGGAQPRGGDDGGGGAERGEWRAAKHLKPAAAELQAHAWPRAAPLNSRRRQTSPLSD
jgi:hypothetical protein